MNNMNFTDWQDLSLKKDVEKIAKNVNPSPEFTLSIIINLIIATLTLAVTAISVVLKKESLIVWIVALAILSFVAPISIVLVCRIRKYRKTIYKIRNKKIPIKKYVDKFDNKVCSNAMMADSLFEHMRAEQDITTKYYCICEINYYINKCIDELYAMKSMSNEVFVDAENTDYNICVSPKRLRLVLNLLNNLRTQTYDEMEKITKRDLVIEEYVNNEIRIHDGRIIPFINEFNAHYKPPNKQQNEPPILSKWAKVV